MRAVDRSGNHRGEGGKIAKEGGVENIGEGKTA